MTETQAWILLVFDVLAPPAEGDDARRNTVGRGASPDAGVRDRVPPPPRPTTTAGDPAEGDDE